ncbi:MAG: aspartyl protease family protein [Phycisphaerales bacterium]|nr:MAG: aspartyl protease family protein [Phycisphaerales bacterium]
MAKLIQAAIIIGMCFSMNTMGKGDDYITFKAYINGQPVLLAFDTGADGSVLFRTAANRLGLEVKEPRADLQPEPGKVKMGITNECLLEFGKVSGHIKFGVVDLPGFVKTELDGVIGWEHISHNIVEISHAPNKIKFHDKLIIDRSLWKCCKIRSDLNSLVMQIPSKQGGFVHVLIDTGSYAGVKLSPELWRQSVDSDNKKLTLSASFYLGKGVVVAEETWVQRLVLEGIIFREVPVSKGVEAAKHIDVNGGLDAILGLHALSCFSWILDGSTSHVYLKPNNVMRIPEKYSYNRLGAVFVHRDIETSDALVGHVVKSGPAYVAGIRDGDILLKINNVDATKWRTDPSVMPLSRFGDQPAGTELNLELMRRSKKIEVSVTLEEIFRD